MSNYREHAEQEFKVLGWPGDCEMQKEICDQVMELLDLFGTHGHSGTTAPYIINLFKNLAMFEAISPLTGEDSEWNDISAEMGGEDGIYQNKRASHVFKRDGKAYDIQGKVFREPSGACFTSNESRVDVTFPYTPKTEYIDVKEEEKE